MTRLRTTPDRLADMHTYSGVPVYLKDPWRTAILARDIRACAAGGSRYNGAPRVSILAHSVLVAALAEADGATEEVVSHCAAHDLAEAVPLGEVVAGLKRYLPEYKALEQIWEPRIRSAVGLSVVLPPHIKREVKRYDLRALACELWWFKHPCLAIKECDPPTLREKLITASVFLPVVGSEAGLWRRLCRWLPRLRSTDVL
jgi:hypothetical protein